MSYIAFDLDALNVAADVGRAAGIAEDRVIGGLARMWAWCFRQKTDVLSETHVKGFFGADAIDALISFNFLAAGASDGVYRVRGADRYLRVAEARKRGGKAAAAAGNLRRGAGATATTQLQVPPSTPPAAPGAEPQLPPSPTPNTEHRTPNTLKEAAAVAAQKVVPLPPLPTASTSPADAFFATLQRDRFAAGYATELPPRNLGSWFSEVMLELNGDAERFEAMVRAWSRDKYWLDRNLPVRGLVSQWRSFVPRRAS